MSKWLARAEIPLYAAVFAGCLAGGAILSDALLPRGLPSIVRLALSIGMGLALGIPVSVLGGHAVENLFAFIREHTEPAAPAVAPDYSALIDEFKKSGRLPLIWQWTARDFVSAANHLRNKRLSTAERSLFNSSGPMMLLYGLALENLLKGLLVAQGVDATSAGALNNRLKTHNLASLWKQAGLPLNDSREDALKNLHWSIEAGKCPVGTKPDFGSPSPVWVALTNLDQVLDLLTMAEDKLRETRPDDVFETTDLRSL